MCGTEVLRPSEQEPLGALGTCSLWVCGPLLFAGPLGKGLRPLRGLSSMVQYNHKSNTQAVQSLCRGPTLFDSHAVACHYASLLASAGALADLRRTVAPASPQLQAAGCSVALGCVLLPVWRSFPADAYSLSPPLLFCPCCGAPTPPTSLSGASAPFTSGSRRLPSSTAARMRATSPSHPPREYSLSVCARVQYFFHA